MADDTPTFTSPSAALTHYQTLCSTLQTQLADANADIADYTESSKELQDELEKELSRMEKSEKEMRRGLEEAREEVDGWKSKYTTTLRDHTNTMTHMQRELESLRTSEKESRTKLRDMELDNDDLEKSEREKDSSLQDLESRYGKSIERIALLEEELVNKAQLEEEVQRLKDELRDLNEEMAVMRTQATNYPPAYPRPLTPPSAITSTASTTSADDDLFATPRKSTHAIASPTLTSPPSISLVKATPAQPLRPSALSSSDDVDFSPAPPLPPAFRNAVLPSSTTANALSRSTKTHNLASTIAAPPTTPKAVRERRADGMIKDMKEMTDRVKLLTQRLDSRRNLVMAGSSIPRASMSPGGLGKSIRRAAPGGSSLGQSVRPGGGRDEIVTSTRPLSRSTMRASVNGGPRSSIIPVRPSSRLSNSTAASTSSRAPTPSGRSPTPTSSRGASALGKSTIVNRPAWGSTAAATSGSNPLASSTRRRVSSSASSAASALGRSVRSSSRASSTTADDAPPLPTAAGRRPSSRNEMLAPDGTGGTRPDSATTEKRRSSLLGRSMLRRPSIVGGGGGGS